jgi:hypothetical protein
MRELYELTTLAPCNGSGIARYRVPIRSTPAG